MCHLHLSNHILAQVNSFKKYFQEPQVQEYFRDLFSPSKRTSLSAFIYAFCTCFLLSSPEGC